MSCVYLAREARFADFPRAFEVANKYQFIKVENCYTRKALITPESMTHSTFDYYSDLVDPLREFLQGEGVNFYEQQMKGPVISEELFKCP